MNEEGKKEEEINLIKRADLLGLEKWPIDQTAFEHLVTYICTRMCIFIYIMCQYLP